MYSVVLMMALSTGGDAMPAGLLHRGGHGCCGGAAPVSCGCLGGGYGGGCLGGGYGGGCLGDGYGGGCWGGGHHRLGLFHRHRGHGCCGAEAACCAPAPVAYGCQGGAYLNPQPLPPGGMKAPPAGKEKVPAPKPKTGTQLSAPATIFVDLPASATLTVDGVATQSTSATRVLATPALDRGTEYHYTLRAELVRNGQTLSTTQRIAVRAGEETRVSLTFGDNVVAQR